MIRLERRVRPLPVVSIIPLIDILLILLVFFMVTSTFLNLDMLQLSEAQASNQFPFDNEGKSVLVRILPGGELATAGQRIPPQEITSFLKALPTGARLLLMPSPDADVQALVRVLDAAVQQELKSVSVLQFEASK